MSIKSAAAVSKGRRHSTTENESRPAPRPRMSRWSSFHNIHHSPEFQTSSANKVNSGLNHTIHDMRFSVHRIPREVERKEKSKALLKGILNFFIFTGNSGKCRTFQSVPTEVYIPSNMNQSTPTLEKDFFLPKNSRKAKRRQGNIKI
mmetsp:Transcript_25274/g.50314  ORF Transcript_25274/g.50314 Transcript_25274/m.50314 type:complete len:147 (+) Transcript_25274:152-592(+)